MENNIKRNKTKIIIISIVFILLLLMISNGVKSAVTIYHSIRSFDKTNDLAYEAVTEPEKFIEYTPGRLFAMNARQGGIGYSYMEDGGLSYKRTICIYHNQPNDITGDANIKTGNIIDIEAPGKVVVYKFEGLSKISEGIVGTITQNGDVVTEIVDILMNNAEGEYVEHTYEVKYTKKELDLTDTEMDDFEAAAYLASRPLGSSIEGKMTENEKGMDWYWKEKLKNHVQKQGVLDKHFDVTITGNDTAEYDETTVREAQTVAQNLTTETANLEKVTTAPQVYYVGDKAYIGPLQVKYTGGTTSLIVEGKSGNIIAKWATKKTGNEIVFNSEQSGNVTSNQQFYAVVDKAQIEGMQSAKVKLTLTSTGGTSYKSRILLSYSELDGMQHMMHFAGTEKPQQTTDEETWTAGVNEVSVTIVKKDSAGTTGLSGVKFELYDANRTKISDITTNNSGNATKTKLERNKTYILKEKINTNYGYRNMNIANATISGGTIIKTDKTNREITFTLTTNGTITINNTPELGKLKIKKIDSETGEVLENVKFILWKSNTGYIQLYNKSNSQFIPEIQSNSEIDITNYTVKYITSITEANKPTKFVTNSLGEITISNLEIYAGMGPKYAYLPIEDENPNYGYANSIVDESSVSIQNGEFMNFDGTDSYIRESDRAIKVLLSSDTTQTTILTVKNKRELGKLQIEKEDSETGESLKDVKFILWQIGTSYAPKGYIQLYDKSTSQFIPEIDSNSEIDITAYTVKYIASITENDIPTKFKTNESGKIAISNLEIYWKEGVKYTYLLIEDENPNYGYNRAIVDESSVDIENGEFVIFDGTDSYIRESDKAIKFLLSEDPTKITVITVENNHEVGGLKIKKVDAETKEALQNVEFSIWRSGKNGGYLKISGVTSPYATPSEGLTIDPSTISYVSEKNQATMFKTNSSGEILIKDLEVYADPQTKYTYYITEEANNNAGYENMIIEGATVNGQEVEVENRQIAINLESEDNTTVEIEIENKNEFLDLTINKVDGSKNLPNVEFAIYQSGTGANGWIKLNDETVIETPEEGIDIRNYTVTYVGNVGEATKFKTNSLGKVTLNNLRMYAGENQKFEYWLRETSANAYGYKGMILKETGVVIAGGTIETVNTNTRDTKVTITDEKVEVTIKNIPYLGGLEITKVDKNDNEKVLPNVEFKVIVDENKYVQLKNSNGQVAEAIGKVTINKDNKATDSEYAIEIVDNIEQATTFITDTLGKIGIENLEVYSGVGSNNEAIKYTYKLLETENHNYGYVIDKSSLENVTIQLTENSNQSQIIPNEKFLGGLSIKKVDEKYPDIVLKDVEFVLSRQSGNTIKYIALYDSNNQFVEKALGPIIINQEDEIKETEYRAKYVSNQDEATKLLTNGKGELLVDNLEVYDAATSEKYTYKLTETYNPHYGYEKPNETEHSYVTQLTEGQISHMSTNMTNEQEFVKISGYVWVENPQGKANGYDNVFTNNNESGDIKLTDLYTGSEGNLVWNANAKIPVKILLQDQNGNVIKDKPDGFDAEGKYTFKGIPVEQIGNYKVVFIYDGLYYSTVVPNLEENKADVSKVKEVQEERNALSNKFTEVGSNGAVSGQENVVTYDKSVPNIATVESISIDTSVSANTSELDINFATELDKLKKSPSTEPVEGIQNINMGLVLREQPDLSIFNDIEKVLVNVNGYEYSYVYATRNLYTEKQEDQLGVKFENEAYLTQRYTRTIYASDIQAAKQDPNMEFSVSVVYKMTIVNENKTLAIAPKEIANYFDSNYEIKSITSKADGEQGDEKVNVSGITISDFETEDANVKDKYKVATIPYTGILAAGGQDEIYITFNIDRTEVLEKLLNGESTHHNAVEINKYTSYYTQETGKDQGKAYTTDIYQGENQQLYAGIDEDSAPGNIEIKLTNHPSGGTQILDTSGYEDDEDAAPSLILVAGEERTISGIVWEDTDLDTTDKERLGDGKYDSSTEKLMGNVVLELMDVGTGEIAKYSNGNEAKTKTNDRGEYTFGGSTDGEGILPGTYIIRYKYNNETYIVGGKNINALDYKSTIITSGVIESALTDITKDITYGGTNYSGDKWYLIEQGDRYSDAVDNMNIRESMSEDSVIFKNYNELQTKTMEANTAIMEIGLEYTIKNEAEVGENGTGTTIILTNNLEKVDFGIIERPRINYIIDKDITSLEIVSQTGASIIPKGNPSNPGETIQGVKSGLEGLVEGEIDENLLQGATLKLEYTITVKNSSETDYTEKSYYYYGRGGQTVATVKIKKVVDYLDTTVKLDPNQEQAHKDDGWLNDDGTEKTYTHTELAGSGLISGDVQSELEKGNCKIFVNEKFADIAVNEEKTARLYISKLLGVSDEINIYNDVEIIELSGGRTITSSIPGNYVPKHDGGLTGGNHENDDDRVKLTITGPTGATINYTAYIIAIAVMFVILTGGIIIIRRTMKKY